MSKPRWRSLVRVLDMPNGVSVVVVDDEMEAWLHALAGSAIGSDQESDIFEAAIDAGRLAELGAQLGLLDSMHRQRFNLGQGIH